MLVANWRSELIAYPAIQQRMTHSDILRKRFNAFYRRRAFSRQGTLASQRRFDRLVRIALTCRYTNERVWRLVEAVAIRKVKMPLDPKIFQHSKCASPIWTRYNSCQLHVWSSHCDTYTCRHFSRVARKSDKTTVFVYIYACQSGAQHTPNASSTYAVTMRTHYHFMQKVHRKAGRRSPNFKIKNFLIPRNVWSLLLLLFT